MGDDRLLGDVLAVRDLLDQLGELVAEHRVALDDVVELLVDERLQAVAHAVHGHDLDVLPRHLAGRLDRLDRAEPHVVVVREDQRGLRVRLERRLDGGLALGAREVAAGLADDLVPDDLVEALLAVDLGAGAERALELEDRRVRRVLGDPLARGGALLAEVGADPCDVGVLDGGVDGAVDQHDRDAGVLDLLQDLVPAGLDHRGERDDVDVLGDEVPQRLDLVLLLLLRVDEVEVEAGLLGEARLDRLGVRGAPAALGAELGEAHADQVVTAVVATATGSGAARGHAQQGGQGGGAERGPPGLSSDHELLLESLDRRL